MPRTDKTLFEQLQMSDTEISQRMALLELSQNDLNLLSQQKNLIENNIDQIVEEFYQRQTAIDEIALLIGDADTLSRLNAAQRHYVIDLFSGQYGHDYVNNRLRIGMIHKRIGVEPKLYLSAVKSLKELISATLSKEIQNSQVLDATLNALDKLLYFDITLVFDTYIDCLIGEVEAAKQRAEDYASSLEVTVAERTKQLEEQTKHDPLTNLYNQGFMQEIFKKELALAQRHNTPLSLLYFDVDDFKQINDIHGHLKGDEVLKFIGQILLQTIRDSDLPCRCGGDEFCVILPDCSLDDAQTVCQKITDKFSQEYPDFSISIGLAQTGPNQYSDAATLINEADQKMYQAKNSNGTQVQS